MIRSPFTALALVLTLSLAGAALAADLFDEKQDAFTSAEPKIELTRPDAAWLFVHLDVQRQEAEAARPGSSKEFEGLIARLHCPGQKATISVFSFPLSNPPPDLDRLAAHAAQEARARKDGAIGGQSQVALGGRQVVMTDYSATIEQAAGGARAGETYVYSRIDCLEPESNRALVILFEVPKEKAKGAVGGWKKVLQKLKLV